MPHRLEEIAFSLARQGAQATPAPGDLNPPVAAPSVAQIVEWDDKKRYGFLQLGKDRVFLHIRDFAERRKRPAVGDRVRFTIGADERGRPCARDAVHLDDGGRITLPALLLLACLLVLPGLALHQRRVDLRWAVAYVVAMGGVSYALYARDKRRARGGLWRVPENTLHLTELLGGWPGAFLAQRRLRHKVSKKPFQVVFWLTVMAYQIAAVGSLQNWALFRQAWLHFRP